MESQDNLRKRLDALFTGLTDILPGTGRLALPTDDERSDEPIRGFVWEIDEDSQLTWCSPEIEQVLGISPEGAIGKRLEDLGFSSMQGVDEAIARHEPIPNTLVEVQTADGSSLVFMISAMQRADASGAIIGYRGVAQIVHQEEERPAKLTMPIPVPPDEIGATTVPDIAPSWGEVLGYSDDGGQITPLISQYDPNGIEESITERRMTIPLRVHDQLIGVIELEDRQDGESWSVEDVEIAKSVAEEFAVAIHDARTFHLTQQALEEMREADRLKTQFLANMSHELRTPLNSIIGFSRVILKGIDGPITDNQKEDLSAIYNAGQHLLGLINDILDVSRIEAGKMELSFAEVDLNEIVRGVMSTAVGLVKDKPIELSVDVPSDLPKVYGDSIRIRQVLLNLVSNAAKFTAEGQIGVSARPIEGIGQKEVVIAVFDTGPGIEPSDQSKIFEPFSQVDASPTRKTGGTGLGLSICRHLVELHGGQIWVESTPGEGSTFAFTIPYQSE